MVFFAALDDERRDQLLAIFGGQISATAEKAAGLAAAANEATGDDSIAVALQRTPAFVIGGTITEGHGAAGPTPSALLFTGEAFRALLAIEDVYDGLLDPSERLDTELRDFKEMAERIEPAQVEKIDSWYGLTLEAADGTKGMTFSVIDFDSESAALDHYGTMTSEPGLQGMASPIGEASAQVEVNANGIDSMLVFLKGDKVVSLHTAQPEGQEPLLSLESLEELAELVASRL